LTTLARNQRDVIGVIWRLPVWNVKIIHYLALCTFQFWSNLTKISFQGKHFNYFCVSYFDIQNVWFSYTVYYIDFQNFLSILFFFICIFHSTRMNLRAMILTGSRTSCDSSNYYIVSCELWGFISEINSGISHVKYQFFPAGTTLNNYKCDFCINCCIIGSFKESLIDWCLIPTLAVFQLYRGMDTFYLIQDTNYVIQIMEQLWNIRMFFSNIWLEDSYSGKIV
jgi:hypothetical protein